METIHVKLQNVLDRFESTKSMKSFIESRKIDSRIISVAACFILLCIASAVYWLLGRQIADILLFTLPLEATLFSKGFRSGETSRKRESESKVAGRKMLYLYWLVLASWNIFEHIATPFVNFLGVGGLIPVLEVAVFLAILRSETLSADLTDMLMEHMPAAGSWSRDIDIMLLKLAAYVASGGKSSYVESQSKSQMKKTTKKDDGDDAEEEEGENKKGSGGGTVEVRIGGVDLADASEGVLVVVTVRPGGSRPACPAEKATKKTRAAVGTSLAFNQTMQLGPLPDFSGTCEVQVREQPTFGAHKVLLAKELTLSDFIVGEDAVLFTEMQGGVTLNGSIKLDPSSD